MDQEKMHTDTTNTKLRLENMVITEHKYNPDGSESMALKEALDEKYNNKADAVGIFTSDKDERGFAEVKLNKESLDKALKEYLTKCKDILEKNKDGGKMFTIDSVSEKLPEVKECPSVSVKIFIAGDYEQARKICNDYCFTHGLCVNLVKNTYIYSAGEECGVIVELINYPRFPKIVIEIEEEALILAKKLREQLNQDSFTIQTFGCSGPQTKFYSWRHLRNK